MIYWVKVLCLLETNSLHKLRSLYRFTSSSAAVMITTATRSCRLKRNGNVGLSKLFSFPSAFWINLLLLLLCHSHYVFVWFVVINFLGTSVVKLASEPKILPHPLSSISFKHLFFERKLLSSIFNRWRIPGRWAAAAEWSVFDRVCGGSCWAPPQAVFSERQSHAASGNPTHPWGGTPPWLGQSMEA